MSPLLPTTWTEALELARLDTSSSDWRRQIGPGLALQGKLGGRVGDPDGLAAIDLEHHGEALVRFRPGRPSLVCPFTRARYSDRMETTARRLALISQALPAPLVRLALDGPHATLQVRLDVPAWSDDGRQNHRGTWSTRLEPAPGWLDLDQFAAWPPSAWR